MAQYRMKWKWSSFATLAMNLPLIADMWPQVRLEAKALAAKSPLVSRFMDLLNDTLSDVLRRK